MFNNKKKYAEYIKFLKNLGLLELQIRNDSTTDQLIDVAPFLSNIGLNKLSFLKAYEDKCSIRYADIKTFNFFVNDLPEVEEKRIAYGVCSILGCYDAANVFIV